MTVCRWPTAWKGRETDQFGESREIRTSGPISVGYGGDDVEGTPSADVLTGETC